MTKELPIDELLRLACIYAEDNRREFLAAVAKACPEEAEETRAFLKQLRAYRKRRWGKTGMENLLDGMVEVRVSDIVNPQPKEENAGEP